MYLESLVDKYRPLSNGDIDALALLIDRYRQYKQAKTLDLAAVATSLTINQDLEMDPLALRAIQETNPTFDPSSLSDYTAEQLTGIANSAKGKYFEYLVAEELNAGETVGGVTLPDGYTAEIAESMSQPGWDLRIVDEQGEVADLLQLKATENVGYLIDTLERYPDITILATQEAASGLSDNAMILDAGLTDHELEATIDSTLEDMDASFLDAFWQCFPILPLLLIAGTQGYKVAVRKQDVRSAVEVAKARTARVLAAGATGAAVNVATNSWMLSILGAISTGFVFDRVQNIEGMIAEVKRSNSVMEQRGHFLSQLEARAI